MASYESYLKELGHTTDNVVAEKIDPLRTKIKSLQEGIENQKQKNDELLAAIEKQKQENNISIPRSDFFDL